MNTQHLFTIEKELESTIKHWWLFLILGIMALLVGIWLFFVPLEGYVALTFLFSAGFLISGAANIYFTIVNRHFIPAWGWNMVSGILMFALGLVLLFNPGFSADILAFYVAFALLFSGVTIIGYSFSLKHLGDSSWGWNLFFGILVILFSIFLLFNPIFSAFTLVVWSAICFLVLGISFFVLAYHLSKTSGIIKQQKHLHE